MSKTDWPVIFFSLNVLLRFWCQGYAGLKKEIGEFYSLEELVEGWCYFCLKYLVEYSGEALGGLEVFCRKVF